MGVEARRSCSALRLEAEGPVAARRIGLTDTWKIGALAEVEARDWPLVGRRDTPELHPRTMLRLVDDLHSVAERTLDDADVPDKTPQTLWLE